MQPTAEAAGSGEAQTFALSYQDSICRPDFKSCNTVCSGEHGIVVVQRQESPQLKDTAKTTPSPALSHTRGLWHTQQPRALRLPEELCLDAW